MSRRAFLTGSASAAAAGLLGCSSASSVTTIATTTTGTTTTTPTGPVTQYFDYMHILSTGQSLATADQSLPNRTKTQPFSNVMFSSGNDDEPGVNGITLGRTGVTFSPLTATYTGNPTASDYETYGNGMADSVIAATQTAGAIATGATVPRAMIMSCSGIAGYTYAQLAGPTDYAADHVNGSPSFQEMMSQVRTAKAITAAQGKTYFVPCVVVIHGEFDDYNPAFLQDLINWQKDCQTGIQAITGQTGTIPFLLSQTCCGTSGPGGAAYAQWQVAVLYPDKFILAGPEYQIPHNVPDPTHLTIHLPALGQRMLGAMFSRAFVQQFVNGKIWKPVMPSSVVCSGTTVVIDYSVPVAPLVLDTSWCVDPGNAGFLYSDANGTTITSVALTGPTQVTLTLSQPTIAASRSVSYAYPDTDPGFGPINGSRGCLRDSSTVVGYYDAVDAVPSQNYSVRWSQDG
jgi:hypothetical protein